MRNLIEKLSTKVPIKYEEFEIAKTTMRKADRQVVDLIDQIQTMLEYERSEVEKTKSMCALSIEKVRKEFL
jgi:hypothetical protein